MTVRESGSCRCALRLPRSKPTPNVWREHCGYCGQVTQIMACWWSTTNGMQWLWYGGAIRPRTNQQDIHGCVCFIGRRRELAYS